MQDKLCKKIAERRPQIGRARRTRTRRPPDQFAARCRRAAASVEFTRKTTYIPEYQPGAGPKSMVEK